MKLLATVFLLATTAVSQTWLPVSQAPVFNLLSGLLLRDGRVMFHAENTPDWWALTPDSAGGYQHGTWSKLASMDPDYGPQAFSSAVLPDGRAIVEGGEYNFQQHTDTAKGEVYDPKTNTWTNVPPPAGWNNIGDASNTVLPNGTYLQASHGQVNQQFAILNPKTMTWKEAANSLTLNNQEMSMILLPNGTVLRVDGETACGSNQSSEIYDPVADTWTCGPQLPVQVYGSDGEPGATVLMYNNQVLQLGGLISTTALLDLSSNLWSLGPIPTGFTADEGPTVVEPNGKVLVMFRAQVGLVQCQAMEYDPTLQTLTRVANPPICPAQGSTRFLPLPTGEILFSNFTNQMYVYEPGGTISTAAAPFIYPPTLGGFLKAGSVNNVLFGVQLNGLSQAVFDADDYQGATNYPLIRLTNANGQVWYAPTHDDSYSGITPKTLSYTKFDMPAGVTPGSYSMQVITSGIPSNTIPVTVMP